MRRNTLLLVALFAVLANARECLAVPSEAALEVFVYTFAGISSNLVSYAESEAKRIFTPAGIRMEWVNCPPEVNYGPCDARRLPTDLVVRLVPKAFPRFAPDALGAAYHSADFSGAYLFYDRILELQTSNRWLYVMLGRVLAHEITHLLLPEGGHLSQGLMRASWSNADLAWANTGPVRLSPQAIRLLHTEVLRRAHANETISDAIARR